MTVKPTQKTRELLKTIALTVMVTAVAAFIGGMKYQAHVNNQVKTEAKNIVSLKN